MAQDNFRGQIKSEPVIYVSKRDRIITFGLYFLFVMGAVIGWFSLKWYKSEPMLQYALLALIVVFLLAVLKNINRGCGWTRLAVDGENLYLQVDASGEFVIVPRKDVVSIKRSRMKTTYISILEDKNLIYGVASYPNGFMGHKKIEMILMRNGLSLSK